MSTIIPSELFSYSGGQRTILDTITPNPGQVQAAYDRNYIWKY